MNKVEIFKDERGAWRVEVNGVNLADAIADGGLSVSFEPGGAPPCVHMTLRADKLNMRLPEATIKAVERLATDAPTISEPGR